MPKAPVAVSHRPPVTTTAMTTLTTTTPPQRSEQSSAAIAPREFLRNEEPRNADAGLIDDSLSPRARQRRNARAGRLNRTRPARREDAHDGETFAEEVDHDALSARIATIWRQYKASPSPQLRNVLVEHYMRTHVRRLAERLASTLPGLIDIDDLCQQGYLGLVDAIERFELDREVKFETFSSLRIIGAMRDYLREIDPVPRLTRTRSKQVAAVIEQFIAAEGRSPSVDEIRGRMSHLPPGEFEKMIEDRSPASIVSFSAAAAESGECADEADAMSGFEDRGSQTPMSRAERRDLCNWLTRGLCQRDRLIVMLYYYEQMTMKEVGRTLGCSESRVSQRLESVIKRLKSRLCSTVGAEQEFWF